MISPFLKRYSSASKNKKFTKIKFNNDFFKNRNNKELFLKTRKNYKLRDNKDMNSKLLNSNSLSITKVTLSNKILTDINEAQSSYRSLNKSKIKNLIERNNNNFKFDMKTDNFSNIFEELKKKKIPKVIFNFNGIYKKFQFVVVFNLISMIFNFISILKLNFR